MRKSAAALFLRHIRQSCGCRTPAALRCAPMRLILAIGFAVAALLCWSTAASAADLTGRASVIDGDTIEIHGQRIRLFGIDAPESRQSCEAGGQTYRCGQHAALALADHVGQRVVACEQRDVDRYGRVIAVCRAGGEDLNAWLVSQGWALAYQRY